jgi:hypothetical protein
LLLLPFAALAANVTASWTHPTQFTDGTSLPLSSIASTRVEYGSCSGTAFGTKAGEVVVPAPATSITINNFAPGTHCFRAFTRTVAAAGGLESGPSGVATKVIAFPPPNPPTIVTIETVAYSLKYTKSGLRLAKGGSIALGVPCGSAKVTIKGIDYNEVSSKDVSGAKPGPFVARCSA